MTVMLRNRFVPVLDLLEHRNLLAGNVTASVSGGILEIYGDLDANQLSIVPNGSKGVLLSALDDTTINGLATPVSFSKVYGIAAFLREGDDILEISDVQLKKASNIYLGIENDSLTLTNVKLGAKSLIALGDGDDTANIFDSTFSEKFQLLAGAGFDSLTVDNVKMGSRSVIDMGADDDTASVTNSVFKERFQFNGRAGNDSFTIDNVRSNGRFVIELGSGDDLASISDSTFKDRFQMVAGAGDDSVIIQGSSAGTRSQLDGGSGSDDLVSVGNTYGSKLEIAFWQSISSVLEPVANDDFATVSIGKDVFIDVASNDFSPTGTIDVATITIVTDPLNGTVVVNGDGTVTYTNDGLGATSDSFEYTIMDSLGNVTNVALVSITIEADPPVANDDFAVVLQGGFVIIPVSDNDTSASSTLDLTSIVIVSPPAFGNVVVNGDGTVTYSHDNSVTTSDSFTYTISDSLGVVSLQGTVNITITGGA